MFWDKYYQSIGHYPMEQVSFFIAVSCIGSATVIAAPDIIKFDVENCSDNCEDLGIHTLPKEPGVYKAIGTYSVVSYDGEWDVSWDLTYEKVYEIDMSQVKGKTYKEMGME